MRVCAIVKWCLVHGGFVLCPDLFWDSVCGGVHMVRWYAVVDGFWHAVLQRLCGQRTWVRRYLLLAVRLLTQSASQYSRAGLIFRKGRAHWLTE